RLSGSMSVTMPARQGRTRSNEERQYAAPSTAVSQWRRSVIASKRRSVRSGAESWRMGAGGKGATGAGTGTGTATATGAVTATGTGAVTVTATGALTATGTGTVAVTGAGGGVVARAGSGGGADFVGAGSAITSRSVLGSVARNGITGSDAGFS